MYFCVKCGCEFSSPVRLSEKHGLDSPPYESIYVCPFCKGEEFKKLAAQYCRCCGAKLKKSQTEYCSAECEAKGKRLFEIERQHKTLLLDSPLYRIARETEHYNKRNGKNLSYGQYVAFVRGKSKSKKRGGTNAQG